MNASADRLFASFFDINRRLDARLEQLKSDLRSDDETVSEQADREVMSLLEWRLDPLSTENVLSMKKKRQAYVEKALLAQGFSAEESRRIASSAPASAIRKRGRPKTEAREAIAALQLHLTTDKSWCDIADEVIGPCRRRKCAGYCPACRDVKRLPSKARADRRGSHGTQCAVCECRIRPNSARGKVCYRCGDRMRKLAGELAQFLRERDMLPPRWSELAERPSADVS